jgi:subtilisin family serine protease
MFAKTILVAAAGNESARPTYEIATAPPAAADGFISVGALQQISVSEHKLAIAAFSNALPVVSAPGVGVKSAKVGGGLASMSGTSMATPHVAGVAALWLEQINSVNPGANIRQLEGRLIGSASLEGIANAERPNAGAGMVQAPR